MSEAFIKQAAINVTGNLFTGKNHSVCLGQFKAACEQGL